MVAEWAIDRAELIARAFTCYFHLANLAEEHHRVRTLRGPRHRRGPAARSRWPQAVAGARRRRARRRAARGAGAAPGADRAPDRGPPARGGHRAPPDQRPARRRYNERRPRRRRARREPAGGCWRRSTCCGGPPSCASTKLDPLDEVRTVMAAFDETLFRLVPLVYRALDEALGERRPAPGRRWPGRSCASAAGSAATATATPTSPPRSPGRPCQSRPTTCCARWRPPARGSAARSPCRRTFAPAVAGAAGRRWPRAADDHPELVAEMATRSPQRAAPAVAAVRGRAPRRHPQPQASTWPTAAPASSWPTCGWSRTSLAEAGADRQAYGELQHLIWQVETFGFHLAELEVRQHSAGARRGAGRARAGGDGVRSATEEVLATLRVIAGLQARFGADACRRYVVTFTRSADDLAAVYGLAGRARRPRRPVLDVVPLFESRRRPGHAPGRAGGMLGSRRSQRRLAADRPAPGGHARLLRLGQGARPGRRDPAPVRGAGRSWPPGRRSTTSS